MNATVITKRVNEDESNAYPFANVLFSVVSKSKSNYAFDNARTAECVEDMVSDLFDLIRTENEQKQVTNNEDITSRTHVRKCPNMGSVYQTSQVTEKQKETENCENAYTKLLGVANVGIPNAEQRRLNLESVLEKYPTKLVHIEEGKRYAEVNLVYDNKTIKSKNNNYAKIYYTSKLICILNPDATYEEIKGNIFDLMRRRGWPRHMFGKAAYTVFRAVRHYNDAPTELDHTNSTVKYYWVDPSVSGDEARKLVHNARYGDPIARIRDLVEHAEKYPIMTNDRNICDYIEVTRKTYYKYATQEERNAVKLYMKSQVGNVKQVAPKRYVSEEEK